ncbi:MAG: hypothetical protein A2284_16445 [Deltaproteobacteria bacterium RIFOXYA12_FULL_61_11]|nr:MAG: hypothetical protein A2284_16445 [Deltaproteobacteria bacterium RIFOXYA12_FULL_61_11]
MRGTCLILLLLWGAQGGLLSAQTSPYLTTAEGELVQWQPWGKATFERAAKEHKPILLYIGAAWCSSCGLMDRDVFRNEAVARKVNQHFLPIKLDRELRPDLDYRYQTVIGAMEEVSGWPLTVMVDHDSKAFWGATYLPLKGHVMQPSFEDVLDDAIQQYSSNAQEVRKTREHWHEEALLYSNKGKRFVLPFDLRLDEIVFRRMQRDFDERSGGFGLASGPKAPNTEALAYLMARWERTGDIGALTMVEKALGSMQRGGIRDHVEGGFHRFGADPKWYVPHFEKLLVSNAELLRVYLQAHRSTGRADFRNTAEEIASYLRRTLLHPCGLFATSQAAGDEPQRPGWYYTFTRQEIETEIPLQAARLVKDFFQIRENPRDLLGHPTGNVLYSEVSRMEFAVQKGQSPQEFERILSTGLDALRRIRASRKAPSVEPLFVAAYNAMACSAFGDLAQITQAPEDEALAANLAERLVSTFLVENGKRVTHAAVLGADKRLVLLDEVTWLNDQAEVLHCFLDRLAVTGDPLWLQRARRLAEGILAWAFDGTRFRDAQPPLAERSLAVSTIDRTPMHDSLLPSAEARAILALIRLADLTGEQRFRSSAKKGLEHFVAFAKQIGSFHASFAVALRAALEGTFYRLRPIGQGASCHTWGRSMCLSLAPERSKDYLAKLAPGFRVLAGKALSKKHEVLIAVEHGTPREVVPPARPVKAEEAQRATTETLTPGK